MTAATSLPESPLFRARLGGKGWVKRTFHLAHLPKRQKPPSPQPSPWAKPGEAEFARPVKSRADTTPSAERSLTNIHPTALDTCADD